MKRLYGIRGAVCTENTEAAIRADTEKVFRRLFEENLLISDDIVSIQFTVTKDITVLNPAAALRLSDSGIDISNCALFCSQEAYIEGSLPRTIRILITAYMDEGAVPRHCYLNGAEILRPDFTNQ